MEKEDKLLSAAAYAIGIPALYIILGDKRKDPFTGFHGAQALFLWIALFVCWIGITIIVDFIWNIAYIHILGTVGSILKFGLWLYALYCGYKAYMGETFEIPYIGELARRTSGF